jgi:hypothetical protein
LGAKALQIELPLTPDGTVKDTIVAVNVEWWCTKSGFSRRFSIQSAATIDSGCACRLDSIHDSVQPFNLNI